MGRHAGFVTAGATVASQDVNFALIPEVAFELEAFLAALKQRMLAKSHAVIAVSEGAGQNLLAADPNASDTSSNVSADIGPFYASESRRAFKIEWYPRRPALLTEHQVRSRPANCEDVLLCDIFARHAVHAAIAGGRRPCHRLPRAFHPRPYRTSRHAHQTPRSRQRLVALCPRRDRATGTVLIASTTHPKPNTTTPASR
jgi:6-phosphofructokinase